MKNEKKRKKMANSIIFAEIRGLNKYEVSVNVLNPL
jgi:hypothetical protein